MKRYRIMYAQIIDMEAIIETDEPLAKLYEQDEAMVPRWARIIRDNAAKGVDYPVRTGEHLDLEAVQELPQ